MLIFIIFDRSALQILLVCADEDARKRFLLPVTEAASAEGSSGGDRDVLPFISQWKYRECPLVTRLAEVARLVRKPPKPHAVRETTGIDRPAPPNCYPAPPLG